MLRANLDETDNLAHQATKDGSNGSIDDAGLTRLGEREREYEYEYEYEYEKGVENREPFSRLDRLIKLTVS